MRSACLLAVVAVLLALPALAADTPPGTSLVDFAGYHDCLALSNDTTRVILGPHCGGRVLSYAVQGAEAIPLNPAQYGYTWQPGVKSVDPYGGRFDIGPETRAGRHTDLWLGPWRGRFTGPREAELISAIDSNLALQLIRTFRLAPEGSHLRCTQKIINRGARTRRVCHWSRTFAQGNGICLVPLNPNTRFPKGYLTYGPGAVMDYSPKPAEHVRVREGFLEINGDPPYSKFMLDTEPGCLAYLMRHHVAFVKRWAVYPERSYNEMCAATLSLYYYPFIEDRQKPPENRSLPIDFCELEPIGPMEILAPGQSASFSEDWWLMPFAFPAEGTDVDLGAIGRLLEECRPEGQ
jgi:hypothetical protein